jgi:serine protease Do
MNRLMVLAFALLFSALAMAEGRSLPDFSELAERQGPAVVNISTTQVIRGQAQMAPFPFDESDPAFEFLSVLSPDSLVVWFRVILRINHWDRDLLRVGMATF